MSKTVEGKRQINIDVDRDVAEHIKNQSHQGHYIEELVRRDIAADISLVSRLEQLEYAVHENHVKIDGLNFKFDGHGCRAAGNHILNFHFYINGQPDADLEMQSLADEKTVRTFAFRNYVGHYAGRGTLHPWEEDGRVGYELKFQTISRIGESLMESRTVNMATQPV